MEEEKAAADATTKPTREAASVMYRYLYNANTGRIHLEDGCPLARDYGDTWEPIPFASTVDDAVAWARRYGRRASLCGNCF